jgi:nucleoside-diphosphate-sugar epimerase
MATLLVIGGSGFFGKSILDMFQRGKLSPWSIDKVIAMSRSAQRLMAEVPELVRGNVELVELDIATTNYLPDADYVIHAAASTDARNYISQPGSEKKNIQAGIYNYCRLAHKFHLKSKIIYVSSGAVYGLQSPTVDKLDEHSQLSNLQNMDIGKQDYAAAKQDAENAIAQMGSVGLNVSIARCFAFVGCWLPRDQHFAVGNFIDDVLNKRPIVVKSTHQVYRSYMYADDLVEWLMTITDHASPDCPTYNVGSDQAILVSDLAKLLAENYHIQAVVPLISDSKIDRYIPSITKANKEIGLYLKFDIFASIQETINRIGHYGK